MATITTEQRMAELSKADNFIANLNVEQVKQLCHNKNGEFNLDLLTANIFEKFLSIYMDELHNGRYCMLTDYVRLKVLDFYIQNCCNK